MYNHKSDLIIKENLQKIDDAKILIKKTKRFKFLVKKF